MPRQGTREDAAKRRQDRKLEAHQVKYGGQPKYKKCNFCGRTIIVNNYEDGKSRTPRWRKTGMTICPWCNPCSVVSGTVTNPTQYKTIMSRVLVEKLAAMNICLGDTKSNPDCKCLGCGARKIAAITDERMSI